MPYLVYLLLKTSQAKIKVRKAKANQFSFRFLFCLCTDDVSVDMKGQKQMHLYFKKQFHCLTTNVYTLLQGNQLSRSWWNFPSRDFTVWFPECQM